MAASSAGGRKRRRKINAHAAARRRRGVGPATEADRVRTIAAGTVRPGDNRRLQGEDLRAGHPALTAGQRLRPADLGLIASLGIAEVVVNPLPRQRNRASLHHLDGYYDLRNHIVDFLVTRAKAH